MLEHPQYIGIVLSKKQSNIFSVKNTLCEKFYIDTPNIESPKTSSLSILALSILYLSP